MSTAIATTSHSSTPANGRADEPPPHPGFDTSAASPMPAPARMFDPGERSQSTQVEQARAIAEVQASIVVAQNRPRDMDRAIAEMRKVCAMPMMADRAFSSYPKGGKTVSMASIHLARELARIWGNIGYGSKELARNDVKGESEMTAYAWDLQTNTRPETTFMVPHFIDLKGGGKKKLTDARSIYENNQNMAARRMRVQIFAILPRWFTDEAEDLCRRTLEDGGGKPFKERLDEALKHMKSIDVTPAMIEKKFGVALTALTSSHLAELRIIYRSLKNGEIERDEAFPETPAADVDAHLTEKAARQSENGPGNPAAPGHRTPDAGAQGQDTAQHSQGSAAAVNGAASPKTVDHSQTVAVILEKIEKIGTVKGLDNIVQAAFAEDIDLLRTDAPDDYTRVMAAVDAKRKWFAR